MKLSKLILGGVAMFALIGGALAFKARNTDMIFVATTTRPTTLCTEPLTSYTISTEGIVTQATTAPFRPCVYTFITTGT